MVLMLQGQILPLRRSDLNVIQPFFLADVIRRQFYGVILPSEAAHQEGDRHAAHTHKHTHTLPGSSNLNIQQGQAAKN